MFDVDAFLSLLDEIEQRKKRRAAANFLEQQDLDVLAAAKAGRKPGPKPKRRADNGKPYTGRKPRTGVTPVVSAAVDEDVRRGRRGGGRASPVGVISPFDRGASMSGHGPGDNGPSSEPQRRPAGPAERLAVAGGSQPAVVKLVSYAAGGARIGKLLTYQSRDGELAVERETGEQLSGGSWIQALADEWAEEDGRQPSKDVLRLSLTVRSDAAIGEALKQAFPGHRIAWRNEPEATGEGRAVDVVMSAAACAYPGERKALRIYDNRKSMTGLQSRLETAFGAGTEVEVHGFAHGVEGVGRYLSQIRKGTRDQAFAVRLNRDGSFTTDVLIDAGSSALEEAKDWKRDLRSQERRDVAHIIFSAKPGTPKDQFVDAARATLAREFAGHRYVFVLHEDRQHLHVHAAVKMRSETGKPLHPRIQDFQRWRKTLAEEARERNIPMDAMSRFERANPPGYKLKDIHRVERGVATENVRRRVEAVKASVVHIPTREEGKRHAVAAAQGWSQIAAIASEALHEAHPEPGDLRLYRAERPGTRSSAPIFTRNRAEAAEFAHRFGGTLSYIDVRSADRNQVASARGQSNADDASRFVVSRELAGTMRPVPLTETETAAVLQFRRRSETAVRSMERMAAETQSTQPNRPTEEADNMANLNVMKTSFAQMDEQMEVIKTNLPADRQPQIEELHGKLKETQQQMLATQESIERKRGTVEGETFVAPVKHEFSQFLAEERGELIRYVSRKENGKAGAVVFTDHGDKVEIAQWKDREAVLAAMQVASRKWGSLTINGTENYKALAVELAAEHGFKITNPELQDRLVAAGERIARERAGRAGIVPGNRSEAPTLQVQSEAAGRELSQSSAPRTTAPIVDGDKVRPADRDRESMLAAMREAAKKWDTITVNGSERDKALAVELAAEHGFKISNPELQDKLVAAQEKIEQRRQKEQMREERRPGFTEGMTPQEPARKSDAEIELALQTVRERTDAEAKREVRQAERSAATQERPFDGGGEDHAYRTQAEANAAVRAERAVDQNPSQPIPAEVSQSSEIERQRQVQQELLSEKQANRQGEAQKQTQKPRHRQ
ncbi:LPD7 domain-containing protein [Rhizobium jaguaris]|uniref:LPD7 domain-containing protein n=1 Tax=Rhizobium jaguaris TaxID=1312183 RepID=UPI001FDFCFE8|nr:LPD7 domain-containing protein [Rhizobium jaguaris]